MKTRAKSVCGIHEYGLDGALCSCKQQPDEIRAFAAQLKKAIDGIAELPGEMPDDLWQMIANNRATATEAFRFTVQRTKKEIRKKIDRVVAEMGH